MKRVLIFGFVLCLLNACSETTPPKSDPVQPPKFCAAAQFQKMLWLPSSALTNVELPQNTRVIRPGTAVTMDYRTDRLNIVIGASDRIERVYCG